MRLVTDSEKSPFMAGASVAKTSAVGQPSSNPEYRTIRRNDVVCVYLESRHLDVEEFLYLRKYTGDGRRRTHNMDTTNWNSDRRLAQLGTANFIPSACKPGQAWVS